MSDASSIEWTDATWNPVRGCTKVSAGCKNCYAERFAERFRGVPGHAFEQGFDLRLVPEALGLPLRWRKPRRVFVNSMSDLFHERVPDDFIDRVFAEMVVSREQGRRHTFQVLTKRAQRMRRWAKSHPTRAHMASSPGIWLGVSVEDQAAADARIPDLLATPAAVRFLSCEPLLGPVDLRRWIGTDPADIGAVGCVPGAPGWVIVGGESGPGARPCALEWIEAIVADCRKARVPTFVKQLGAYVVSEHRTYTPTVNGRPARMRPEDYAPNGEVWAWRAGLRDRKGGDPAEWPKNLRVREMP